MGSENDFFEENAFGDIYDGTFFAEDVRSTFTSSDDSIEEAKFREAVSKVRMSTEVDVTREANRAINSAYDLVGLGGEIHSGGITSYFMSKILGGRVF